MNRHIKITMTGPQRGQVWVDGEEVKDVVSVEFQCDVEKDIPSNVRITRRVYGTVEVNGQMDVTTLENDGTRRFVGAQSNG